MRKTMLFVAASACLLMAGLELSAAVAGDTTTLPLKDFKFLVPDKPSDLVGYNDGEEKLYFYINGVVEGKFKVPADGDYEFTLKASGDPALKERAKFKFSIDGKLIGKETELTADDMKDYKFSAELKSGDHKLTVEYTNDVYKEGEYDRNFYLHGVSLKKKAK